MRSAPRRRSWSPPSPARRPTSTSLPLRALMITVSKLPERCTTLARSPGSTAGCTLTGRPGSRPARDDSKGWTGSMAAFGAPVLDSALPSGRSEARGRRSCRDARLLSRECRRLISLPCVAVPDYTRGSSSVLAFRRSGSRRGSRPSPLGGCEGLVLRRPAPQPSDAISRDIPLQQNRCDFDNACPVRDSNPPHRIKSPALYQMS
jgi:hypothetical protein